MNARKNTNSEIVATSKLFQMKVPFVASAIQSSLSEVYCIRHTTNNMIYLESQE